MNNQTTNNPTPTQPITPAPAVQPMLSQDSGAALLAELQKITAGMDANRQAVEAGFERLADELTAAELASDRLEEPEAILITPAATVRSERSTSATRRRDSESPNDVEYGKRGIPKRHRGESRSDYLDRLRSLPPVGPEKILGIFEPPDIFRARRFDGTSDE